MGNAASLCAAVALASVSLGCDAPLDSGDHSETGSTGAGTGPGAKVPVVIAEGQPYPFAVRAGSLFTWWINRGTGDIVVSDKEGANVVAAATNRPAPTDVRTDTDEQSEGWAYFTDDSTDGQNDRGVFKVARAGGEVLAVDTDEHGAGTLTMSGDLLYSEAWGTDVVPRVRKSYRLAVDQHGGCYLGRGTQIGGRIATIAVVGQSVFFFELGTDAIMQAPIDCKSDPLPSIFAASQPTTRVIRGSSKGFVVWATADAVYRMAAADPGGEPERLGEAEEPEGLTLVDLAAAYTNRDGTIRLATSGEGAAVLAVGQPAPTSIDYDENPPQLIWTTEGPDGRIVRLDL